MISEKPSWIRHDGLQIFSIDIQPGGLRFATGGADHKVRIWDINSVAGDFDKDDQTHGILATLRDHNGSVNCVRWAKHGRYIASGSVDQLILIHEMKPGSGTSKSGSGEPFDVENWKVVMTLRGHTRDVVDLTWSPDDSILASGGLDKTIHIWNMSNGICTAVLRGHSSFVKGVAWDPIGSFLASQSDDKSVIIWRTDDWSLVHKTDGHLAKSLDTTFFTRLGWSTCGRFLITTHGFQKPRPSAPVLERGKWASFSDFTGHDAPITVVKFNHSMFKRQISNAQDVRASSSGRAKGSTKSGGAQWWSYNVIAFGSQDRTISVWTTVASRPLFVATDFFTKSVVDLSWSPDGYSLFACSLDGSVSTFHFEVKEIGQRLTDDELDELNRNLYGDFRSQQSNLAAKQNTSRGRKKKRVTFDLSNKVAASVRVSRSAKQKEYKRPNVRRRNIIPVSHSQVSDLPLISSKGNKVDDISEVGKTLEAGSDVKEHSGVTTKAFFSDGLVIERVGAASGIAACNATLAIRVVDRKEDAVAMPITLEARPREQAVNDIVGMSNTSLVKETEVICRRGSQTLWSDRISGKVSILAGNANFWTVGFEDGCLQVYTKCGRRAMPTMMMGSDALFLECDECWKLLLITKKGSLYLWDLFSRSCLLQDTLASLFAADPMAPLHNAGTIKIISAKVSKSGSPLVVLATRHAFLYDMSLKCWLRVADDCFLTSNFASSLNMGSSQCGELSTLQVDVRKFLARKPVWSRVADDGLQTRSQLEAQLASALTLKSANEYRQCLVSYVRHLARKADESRLREVCESFLGPPIGMGAASSNQNIEWDPCVLGLKKHELLRDDILPAVASNRKVQRLLNEFIDRLSEYGTVENQSEQNNSIIPI